MGKVNKPRWSGVDRESLKDVSTVKALFSRLRYKLEKKYTRDDGKLNKKKFTEDWEQHQKIEVSPPRGSSIDNFKKEDYYKTCRGDLNCYCIVLLDETLDQALDIPKYNEEIAKSAKQNIVNNDTMMGVEEIFSSKSPQDILELIAEKKPQHIWFFGTHFNINLSCKQELLLQLLAEGTKLSFLFLNPLQTELTNIQHSGFGVTTSDMQNSCKSGLCNLIAVMKLWKDRTQESDYSTRIRAKITNNIPRIRAYIVDPDDNDATSYIIPYMNHLSAGESPVLACKNIEGGLSLRYFQGIKQEWDSTETYSIQHYIEKIKKHSELERIEKDVNFEEFIAKYSDFLKDYPESDK